VAFTKKPKNTGDVLKEMYNGKDELFNHPYDDIQYSTTDIARQVFDDIKEKKKISKKDLVEHLAGRYFVLDNDLYYRGAAYHGTNAKLTEEFVQLELNSKKELALYYKNIHELETEYGFHPSPKSAYAGHSDWNTKLPYTNEEIETYSKYLKKLDKFHKTNVDYIKLMNDHNKLTRSHWDTASKMRLKLAEEDAEAFINDNKGKYVFTVRYSDNDGSFMSFMEHSDIFSNVKHIHISEH